KGGICLFGMTGLSYDLASWRLGGSKFNISIAGEKLGACLSCQQAILDHPQPHLPRNLIEGNGLLRPYQPSRQADLPGGLPENLAHSCVPQLQPYPQRGDPTLEKIPAVDRNPVDYDLIVFRESG